MAFYYEIAERYDRVFPFDKAQAKFVIDSIKARYHTLDIDCGTGYLALSREGSAVMGIFFVRTDIRETYRCSLIRPPSMQCSASATSSFILPVFKQ